mmetsp:Transcript_19076/g.51275  ORF Transcript_19076/g.51275 Transcript_19076/m.51275 type:complete len:253 (+) Transcript_19076:688-1446(+)
MSRRRPPSTNSRTSSRPSPSGGLRACRSWCPPQMQNSPISSLVSSPWSPQRAPARGKRSPTPSSETSPQRRRPQRASGLVPPPRRPLPPGWRTSTRSAHRRAWSRRIRALSRRRCSRATSQALRRRVPAVYRLWIPVRLARLPTLAPHPCATSTQRQSCCLPGARLTGLRSTSRTARSSTVSLLYATQEVWGTMTLSPQMHPISSGRDDSARQNGRSLPPTCRRCLRAGAPSLALPLLASLSLDSPSFDKTQ